jgi:hypothetical protein
VSYDKTADIVGNDKWFVFFDRLRILNQGGEDTNHGGRSPGIVIEADRKTVFY